MDVYCGFSNCMNDGQYDRIGKSSAVIGDVEFEGNKTRISTEEKKRHSVTESDSILFFRRASNYCLNVLSCRHSTELHVRLHARRREHYLSGRRVR